jgi:hypothetical protein
MASIAGSTAGSPERHRHRGCAGINAEEVEARRAEKIVGRPAMVYARL